MVHHNDLDIRSFITDGYTLSSVAEIAFEAIEGYSYAAMV